MEKYVVLLLAGLVMGGCGERAAESGMSDGECVAMANALNTLQEGDPLPRVVQVVGEPSRTYRVYSTFGKKWDVLEYDVGLTPCARSMLDARQKFELVFDEKGTYVGSGRGTFRRIQAASMVRVQEAPIDLRRIGY